MKEVGFLIDRSIGADPEVFIKEVQTGKFVPSLDLIGGTKENPRPVKDGFSVQEDNILGEYNIPPSRTREEFNKNILLGMKYFQEVLPPQYALEIKTSHKFLPDQLTDPRANEFGCTPDQNAWLNGKYNPKPPVPKDGLRSAGGHVHIGYSISKSNEIASEVEITKKDVNVHIVRWLDLFLAVPATKLDLDTDRRKLYGKAGAYRDKPYGLEYRTLSSFWLQSKELIDWVYDKTQEAVDMVSTLKILDDKWSEKIQLAVNTSNKKVVDELVGHFNLQIP